MKTIYKTVFFCLALMLGFVSCDGKHDKIPPTGGRDNAEKLIVGTYVGEWSCENLTVPGIEYGTGSMTFSVDEELGNNVSIVKLTADINLGDGVDESVCNVTRLSSGVLTFWNYTKTNPFGSSFYGTVSPTGEATITYNKIRTVNRREREFKYVFVGRKQ